MTAKTICDAIAQAGVNRGTECGEWANLNVYEGFRAALSPELEAVIEQAQQLRLHSYNALAKRFGEEEK